MLGCQNQSCMRRFCRHCLLTHLGEEDEMVISKEIFYKFLSLPRCSARLCHKLRTAGCVVFFGASIINVAALSCSCPLSAVSLCKESSAPHSSDGAPAHTNIRAHQMDGSGAPPWYCPICRNKCCCAKSDCSVSSSCASFCVRVVCMRQCWLHMKEFQL